MLRALKELRNEGRNEVKWGMRSLHGLAEAQKIRCLQSSSGCKILVSSISMVLLKPKVNFFGIFVHNFRRGMTPEDAELQYLDNARKLPLYGVDLHTAVVCTVLF